MEKQNNHIDRRGFLKIVGISAATTTAALYGCGSGTKSSQGRNASSPVPTDQMTYRSVGGIKDKVSLLGYGCMRWPTVPSPEGKGDLINQEAVNELVDYAIAHGVNYFDTSPVYVQGWSEKATGIALKRHPREKLYIATKLSNFSNFSRENSLAMYHQSFKDMQVEYFDYYLLHNVFQASYETAKRLDAFGFAREKLEEGKIRHLGFSYHADAELLEEILKAHPEVEFVQLQLNYLDWESPYIQSRRCYEVCRRYGKDVIVMEPVKGGTLADVPEAAKALFKERRPEMSPASWAVRFAAGKEGVIMVLSGMSDEAQLLDNTSYMQDFKPLDETEEQVIRQVTDILNSSIAVGCTGCRYCVEGCPKQIAIPEYFSLYNQYRQFGDKSNAKGYYPNYTARHGAAADCIGCKKCEYICPQHLPIAALMEDVSAVFDA